MGKRGPKGEPTHLKVVKGTAPADAEEREPRPADDIDLAPLDDMADDVREVWDYTVAQLDAMGLAHACDRDALLCYCEAVVTHRKASRGLRGGLVLQTQRGGAYYRNPLIAVQRDAAAQVRAFAREFGLTPSARSDFNGDKGGDHGTGPERYLS